MKRNIALLFSFVLAACATAPPTINTALFEDRLFAPPSEPISAQDVFAITPEMRHRVRKLVLDQQVKGPQEALFDALYKQADFKLEYDASTTHNAAQTFHTRSGNCLSLAIMTAALAKEIGLSVQYRRVYVDEMWSRSGDLYFSSGHINLSLDKKVPNLQGFDSSQSYTVDFLPPDQTAGQRVKIIQERTVVAMYMNNRAAEALVLDKVDDAYWWAREAVTQDPGFIAAYNTLGVVYRRHGNSAQSQRVLSNALDIDPKNTMVMFNLAQALKDLGRNAESAAVIARLNALQPYPPYHFYNLGREAMNNGDFAKARDMFAKEVDRDPYNHEFQFGLASAYFRLGDLQNANKHMKLAMEYSTSRSGRELYAAKLDRLRAYLAN